MLVALLADRPAMMLPLASAHQKRALTSDVAAAMAVAVSDIHVL
jgi:hypothetical protein